MGNRIDYGRTSPDGVLAFCEVETYLSQCGLDETLIDLVYLRVSQINGCAYCTDLHTRMLTKEGLPANKLALVQVWAFTEEVFSLKEKAALAWAEHVTLIQKAFFNDEGLPETAQCFTEKELFDLTLAASLMNAYNRLAVSFRNAPHAVAERQGGM
ncbi:carboxymuconolactone decarboxylase family protein [Serratia rubidaea]|uniref:Argininosuccinate synthase n=1 Tax=Serratia rubidaea TaxID=61652 RepID=A0A3S5AWG6_SERRU|nr:carboxymuconolactone decarboxylase family protein [Serratia rubidaea]MDC6118243.1 carboxymuconolactone decarboxylase family protein [Serratia rubidaea]MEB7585366.1 carboxymuconolactone decarboxylase family protein [Serratia rubidaea]VEI67757.1 Argininosuccinate synthase [Serratia rubidaea]